MEADRNRVLVEPGSPERLGATVDGAGVNFAVYSRYAEAVELALFDNGLETALPLPDCVDGVWNGFVPRCEPGQCYGFRVHGPYAPNEGLRFNSRKLLLDPYTREIRGEFTWRPEVFDYTSFEPTRGLIQSSSDSAPFVPKSVVTGGHLSRSVAMSPRVPWSEMVIYEANVRGYTMHHPEVSVEDRGTFRGMRNGQILRYLRSLGISSIELLPVHAFVDEEFLVAHGLRNYWGYNSIGFFAPAPRLLGGGSPDEFREMVDAIHDAGIEVILDVVYNHTAEGGRLGPTLSLRGIDNPTYYRLLADDRSDYVNDTGTGNTINTDSPVVRRLIVDSLRYWAESMGVDGFRFDLATILGRSSAGFERDHPLFSEIQSDPVLRGVKLIAEPWDVGPGGYQLGGCPAPWAEWNDRYRDSVRRFWAGDPTAGPEFARRIHGSADLFESTGRGPWASVNFVTAHDGFTLADCVSYREKHNEANGEGNRDGHAHNHSVNHGVEGESDDPDVLGSRRVHRLNLLATLLLSQGTPMLLAGDEFGNSQGGNNNAYAQDNGTGWIDWSRHEQDPEFTENVRELIRLRRSLPVLTQDLYQHDASAGSGDESGTIDWLRPDGEPMKDEDWQDAQMFGLRLSVVSNNASQSVLLLYNATAAAISFKLPSRSGRQQAWALRFSARPGAADMPVDDGLLILAPFNLLLLSSD